MCGYSALHCLFTICTVTKGLQKAVKGYREVFCISPNAHAYVMKCLIFSINGLATHELALMARSVMGGLKPLFSPLPPQNASFSVLQMLRCVSPEVDRVFTSSGAAFYFCHYTICSIQQLPLQPWCCFSTQIGLAQRQATG